MTTFLKFPSEGDFNQALFELGLTPASEVKGDGFVLSVVGLIPDGGTEEEPTYIDGYHVNLLGEVPEGWDAMVVQVSSPVRVFG
jgi:hypothetical protein